MKDHHLATVGSEAGAHNVKGFFEGPFRFPGCQVEALADVVVLLRLPAGENQFTIRRNTPLLGGFDDVLEHHLAGFVVRFHPRDTASQLQIPASIGYPLESLPCRGRQSEVGIAMSLHEKLRGFRIGIVTLQRPERIEPVFQSGHGGKPRCHENRKGCTEDREAVHEGKWSGQDIKPPEFTPINTPASLPTTANRTMRIRDP